MKCKNCESSDLEADPLRGIIFCTDCGIVQDEDSLVSGLTFTDNKSGATQLAGQIIQISENFTKVGKSFIQTSSFYIESKLQNICIGLGLSSEHAANAFRWYKMSLQFNISKGKNILYTLSACVYIVCRQIKSSHLLIDFANLLKIDVFKIGKVYSKLNYLLGIKSELIDPSVLLPRYNAKLKLGNKVLNMSIRIVGRMKRDWIYTGRRCNNLCGAALLIASRIYNEDRSIDEVAEVVNVSVTTINKRLKEISETQSADLSVQEYFNVWLENEEDPPAIRNKKPIHIKELQDIKKVTVLMDSNEKENLEQINSLVNENNEIYIDDAEIENVILSTDEIKRKEKIWDEMYGEYMKWKESKPIIEKKPRRRTKKKLNTVEDAIKDCLKVKKLGKKVNFDVIKRLFD